MFPHKKLTSSRIKQFLNYILIVIPILILMNGAYSWFYNVKLESTESEYMYYQREQLNLAEFAMENLFENLYNDLNVIRRSDEFNTYLNEPTPMSYEEFNQLLYRIAQSKPYFAQIRFIDVDGKEVARVNQGHNQISVVPQNELQDKSGRYYFTEAIMLDENELYVSDFDLNIEKGEVVIPYEPVVRFAIPIVRNNLKEGILIINYDGYSLLETLDSSSQGIASFVELGIIDKNYYWPILTEYLNRTSLINQIVSAGKKTTAALLDTEIEKTDQDNFTIDDLHYHYRYLDIDFGNSDDKIENQWIVISTFNIRDVINKANNTILKYPALRLAFLIAVMLTTALLMFIRRAFLHQKFKLFITTYLASYTHNPVIVANRRGEVIYCNAFYEACFGYQLHDLKGKHVGDIISYEKFRTFQLSEGEYRTLGRKCLVDFIPRWKVVLSS